MANALPYFKWYPGDADTDEEFRKMGDSEIGFYIRCLNHSWLNKGIPADPAERARALRDRRSYADKMWERVGRKFITSPDDPTRLVNPRQEFERKKAIEKSRRASDSVRARYEVPLESEKPSYERTYDRTYERRENVDLRAYESESVSGSVSQEGGLGGTKDSRPDAAPDLAIQLAPVLDDSPKFQEAALAVGMHGSETDWQKARWEWKRLDVGQRLDAVTGLYRRKQAGEYDDPGFIPLPQNYLKNRMWQRPIRIKARDSPKETKMDRVEQLFIKHLIEDEQKRQHGENSGEDYERI